MNNNQFMRWNLDRRFFYVWFSTYRHEPFKAGEGPCLAVCDDFGNLVPTDW